jgi:MFS transporter, DHA1 family, multidrug resistance protein
MIGSRITRTAMSSSITVILLTLLLGIQPVTTDLYLPALPALTDGFGAHTAQAQLTLTALLLAFGASQLIWGPLSDRFGRRPILLWGLGLYAAASVLAAIAPSMQALVFARALQGAAMGAAVMCARAIVRDLYAPELGARVMSKGLTGLGLFAVVSPPLGGWVAQALGWRAALGLLAVFGVCTLVFVALRYQETLRAPKLDALQPTAMLRAWGQILQHPTFWAWALLQTASYGGLFTFLAASSFVFLKVYGLSPSTYGLLMCTASGTYIAGTFLCRWLLPRYGLKRSVRVAGALSLAGGSGVGLLALMGWHQPAAFLLPFYLFMLGHGIHQPCSQSGALGPFPQMAGTAAALAGFIMMCVAFSVGQWLGWRIDGTVFALTNGIWFWSVMIALIAWTLVQRFGEPQHATPLVHEPAKV